MHKALRSAAIGNRINPVILLVMLAWALPALACNYPRAAPPANPQGISAQALRQTLDAMSYSGTATVLPPSIHTPTPAPTDEAPGSSPMPPLLVGGAEDDAFLYYAQSGDTVASLSKRFDVAPDALIASQPLPENGFLTPGLPLYILDLPLTFQEWPALLPDSEIVFSPTSVDFDIQTYIDQAGGYLSLYGESIETKWHTGPQVVRRVAYETSTNPRLLLAFLEYRSNWVLGHPRDARQNDRPIGFYVDGYRGLYKELSLAAKQLNIGYYGWRSGDLKEFSFKDKSRAAINPHWNAGSVALGYLFSKLHKPAEWEETLYTPDGFMQFYQDMFGDPWARAARVEPHFTPDLVSPVLELPFVPGERWSFSGGPHKSWNTGTPNGAVDFSPVTGDRPCSVSRAWTTAAAPGLIVRSESSAITLDLDGDGFEQTGWVLLYYHVAEKGRIAAGSWVEEGTPIGHPSCEGGSATGTHVHLARKYNGEWIPVDGPLPLVLSGWTVVPGEKTYQGYLVNADGSIPASPLGTRSSVIVR